MTTRLSLKRKASNKLIQLAQPDQKYVEKKPAHAQGAGHGLLCNRLYFQKNISAK